MRKLITKLNNRLIFTVLLLVTIFVISGCSSKNQPVNNEVNNKTENVNNSTTDTQNAADTQNTADETKQDDPVDAGNFTLTNFIGAWLSESDEMAFVIDSDYNWQACFEDTVYTTGTIIVDGGKIRLYTIDDVFYCELTYVDKYVVDEYNNKFVFDGPVEAYVPEGKIDLYQSANILPSEAGLLIGRYYDDSELHYIEISEGLHYEMYGPTDDGYISSIDCGYIEKLDEMGNYLVTPTLYVDDKPFEIFQFDTDILLWNEESWIFKTPEEYPDIQPVNANGEYGYLLPGRYYSLVGGEVDFNNYIDISEDFKYEMMVANVSDPDGSPLIDCGYITPTSDSHTYIATPELYVTDEPFEIYATPDGFIDWSVSTNPGVNMWHHDSDVAEE